MNSICAKCGGIGQYTVFEYGVLCTSGCCVAFSTGNGMKMLNNENYFCDAPKQKVAAIALCSYCEEKAELYVPPKQESTVSQVQSPPPAYVHRNTATRHG